MTDTPKEVLLEAALFFEGGPVSMKELAVRMKLSAEELEEAATSLAMSLEGRGIRVVREGGKIALSTAPEAHSLIESMRREELEGPLGKAGLETLSIVIFRSPLSRSDIEYVRGVNSSSILRSLLIRGLVERVENPSDKRSYLYQPTPDLAAYLGVESLSKLPDYDENRAKIEAIFRERDEAASTAPESNEPL